MAEVLKVSEQGYYKSCKNGIKPYKHEALLAMIHGIRAEHPDNANYGTQRVYIRALQAPYNYKGSYRSIYRVMKENNLLIKQKKHPNGITKADRDAQKSENLIKQDFTAQSPNEKWLSDITEVPCADGKLYVSAVLDCFDGAIVGLTFDDNMRKELCITSFEQACNRYNARNMIFHSDRGSQYTSKLFRESLQNHGVIQSMSGTGRCYDNARMESFFATLKKEKLYKIKTELMPMETVKTIIFRYVEIYYNRNRIYTTNTDGYPPLVYRQMYYYNLQETA